MGGSFLFSSKQILNKRGDEGMSIFTVNLSQPNVSYPIKIEAGILDRVAEEVAAVYKNKRLVIITDANVNEHYGGQVQSALVHAGYTIKRIVLEPGEQTKSFDNLADIYSQLIDFGLTRSDLIIALGGGVIGDLAGFVAASYLRGISFIQIPTTLLAQVDSSVGGKVAVDLPQGKNLVGDFYHPELVLIDPNVLNTLEDSTFADGMAEVIKYGCIADSHFFRELQKYDGRSDIMSNIETIIEKCCRIKADMVQEDEKDIGKRMLLNFGHTTGHAIEVYYNYEKYTHGQAVAMGMVAMNSLTETQGWSAQGTTAEIINTLLEYDLPIQLENTEDYKEIIPLIKNDKKNLNGQLNIVILNDLGSAKIMTVKQDFFRPLLTKGEDADHDEFTRSTD